MKYLTMTPEQVQYHPMIIKYALGLHTRSPAVYEQLHLKNDGTGILVLPLNIVTTETISAQRGFVGNITTELREKTKSFSEI